MLKENQGIVVKVARMYCNNSYCRQDLIQDILVQLWRSFPKYDPGRKFTTWMYRIALNTAISQFRKSQTEKLEFNDVLPENKSDKENLTYEKQEESRLLHLAISKLGKAEKAICMLYMDDYPYEEISEIMGISVSNVGVKINRIKKKLKKHLKEVGYGL